MQKTGAMEWKRTKAGTHALGLGINCQPSAVFLPCSLLTSWHMMNENHSLSLLNYDLSLDLQEVQSLTI